MFKKENSTIVVKIGTNVLSKDSSYNLDYDVLQSITNQIFFLISKGLKVVIVTSGAVGCGKQIKENINTKDLVCKKQIWASLGQTKLINTYSNLFEEYAINVGQILATKMDFSNRQHYLNIRRYITTLLSEDILPIINENGVSITELMFTDNDELAGLIATMLNAKKFVILTNVDGLYKDIEKSEEKEVIKEVDSEHDDISKFICPSASSLGRGGMYTKCNTSLKAAKMGTDVYIANGRKKDILIDIYFEKNPGTKFVGIKDTSNIKKWIGFSEDFAKGSIVVDKGLEKILVSKDKKTSILPVGIVKTNGNFGENDLIEIKNTYGEKIGIGISQYNKEELDNNLKKNNENEVIHYDYLYIY